ncbi:hypothetical protein M9Y10_002349 [Tritrichomonas musculus]|uniref:TAFII28-like protein domain-containing protein n=1 Tax=Tritrichomonas musculus TaxID=1915356 RepID=A0ABR2L9I9_9EUKA
MSLPRMNSRDTDEDDRDIYEISEDNEDQEFERNEAIAKVISEMTDEQRERFNLFRVGSNCKPPQKRIKEMMLKTVQGYSDRSRPDSISVQESAAFVASSAAKLFIADLLETAKSLSDSDKPLTPDLIYLAYNEIDNAGKIPGRGSGIKRAMIR